MEAGAGPRRALLRQVLGWRVAAAVAWAVLLLPVCTAAFVVLSGFDPFHPLRWISNSFNDLYTSRFICCTLLMSVVILIISICNVQFYAVVPSIPCSRLALIGKIIHPQHLIHSFAHAAMGLLVAWCASLMTKGKFQFLAVPCTPSESPDAAAVPQRCLNEYHLFFLLSGTFVGYSYSLLYLINNMNYLPFPIIQQYKYLRFRRSLPLLIKHSCVESLYFIRNFCVTYYFFGYIPKAWLSTTMNLHIDSKLHPLDTLTGLLDLSLFYHAWLCGVFLLVTWYMALLLFKIYATETHHFLIQPTFAEETDQCLPKILNSNPPLIIKVMEFQPSSQRGVCRGVCHSMPSSLLGTSYFNSGASSLKSCLRTLEKAVTLHRENLFSGDICWWPPCPVRLI